MARMTKAERTARNLCAFIQQNAEGGYSTPVTVEWVRNATWGANPTIRYQNDRCCNVSGCGYCKHSTALADSLQYLGADEEEQSKIARTAGAGVGSVMQTLESLGWKLTFITSTNKTDTYTIGRIA